jgi:hypothetical protein
MSDTCNDEMTTAIKMPVVAGRYEPAGQGATVDEQDKECSSTFSAANL